MRPNSDARKVEANKVSALGERLGRSGPKRILAIDGGGIRGLIALAYLERIEAELRARYDDPQFRLCDYYDLIGGTSTGAIVAAGLACGYSVEDLIKLYRSLGTRIFRHWPHRWAPMWPLLWTKYSGWLLGRLLRGALGSITFGAPEIKTGLAIITKRLDTNSPWIVVNNPNYRYFYAPPDDPDAYPNADYPLWRLIRASAAAPTFFPPVLLPVRRTGKGLFARKQRGLFVDGGMSTHNNPALALLMVARLNGFGLNWPLERDKLLLTSIGTGTRKVELKAGLLRFGPGLYSAFKGMTGLLEDGDELGRTLLQWITDPHRPEKIDRLLGEIDGELLAGHDLMRYARYNIILGRQEISDQLGIDLNVKQVKRINQMDNPNTIDLLLRIGRAAAHKQVSAEHDFPTEFDIQARATRKLPV